MQAQDDLSLLVGSTLYRAQNVDGVWYLNLPSPNKYITLPSEPEQFNEQYFVRNGTLHRIVICADLSELDIRSQGESLSRIEGMEEQTNVMFLGNISQHSFQMASWERGGTGVSLACGSGASASAWILRQIGRIGDCATVHCPGGDLRVQISSDGDIRFGAAPQMTFTGFLPMEICNA